MGAVFVIKAAYVGGGGDQEGSHIFSSPLLQSSAEKENTRSLEMGAPLSSYLNYCSTLHANVINKFKHFSSGRVSRSAIEANFSPLLNLADIVMSPFCIYPLLCVTGGRKEKKQSLTGKQPKMDSHLAGRPGLTCDDPRGRRGGGG